MNFFSSRSKPKCKNCGVLPAFGSHEYCSKTCAKADQGSRSSTWNVGGRSSSSTSYRSSTIYDDNPYAEDSPRSWDVYDATSFASGLYGASNYSGSSTYTSPRPRPESRDLCKSCVKQPKTPGFDFCSRACGKRSMSMSISGPSSPGGQLARRATNQPSTRAMSGSISSILPSPVAGALRGLSAHISYQACVFPSCKAPRFGGSKYCGKYCLGRAIRQGLEHGYLKCRDNLKKAGSQFCGDTCQMDATKKAPLLLEVPSTDPKFTDIANQFKVSWKVGTAPEVRKIYKVVNSEKLEKQYEAYRDLVEREGKFSGRGKAPGNERRRWHGTTRVCRIGDTSNDMKPCSSSNCKMCCIIRTSFMVEKSTAGWFGKGIYSSATSSASNDYIPGPPAGSTWKAMFLNRVVVGRAHILTNLDMTLKGPPTGCHSVVANVNASVGLAYDELVVYRNDAIRTSWLLVYG